MTPARTLSVPLLLGVLVGLAASRATAQAPSAVSPSEEERVQLIIAWQQPPRAKRKHQQVWLWRMLARMRNAVAKHAGEAPRQALALTKAEVWSVPKSKVEAVRKTAAQQGAVVTEVGPDSHHVVRAAPADTKMGEKHKAVMDLAKASKSTVGIRLVTGPPPQLLEHVLTSSAQDALSKIAFELSDQTVVTINRTGLDVRADRAVWRGKVEGTGDLVTLMWWPSGRKAGTIRHAGHIYAIRHIRGRIYAIVQMSEEQMPQEHAPMPERMRVNDPNLQDESLVKHGDASVLRTMTAGMRPPPAPSPQAKASSLPERATAVKGNGRPVARSGQPSKDIVIDVIVAYTRKAASHYTDIKRELVELAIEEANESFRSSNVDGVRLRLVHAYRTDYVERGTHFDQIWHFADKGDGHMEEIHGLRDKYRGDVAVLIVDDPNGCGLSTRVFADAHEAFSVVHHECAATTYSLAHEIGHLIGARHDLNMDASKTPFPYGHGYVSGTKWRDIMSYKQSCGGCQRLPVWSGPNVTVEGETAGSADLDNARVIREQAARVAGFR